MFERRNAFAVCMGLALLAPCLPSSAADEASELSSLKQEIEALKAGQRQLEKDIEPMKKLIQALKTQQQQQQPVVDIDQVMDVAQEPFKGDADAPLTLVELTDFQCPFCGRHVKSVMPEIFKNYVSTGKLKYVVRDFPLPFHQDAGKAAEAAHCAGKQGKYWEMHDLLFESQKALDPEHLAEYATKLALDANAFSACLQSGEFAKKVQASQAEGSNAGVTGTPTFLLGRTQADGKVKLAKRITGAQPYRIFQQTIDTLLGVKAGETPTKTTQPEKAGS